jgi:hypothetical protein
MKCKMKPNLEKEAHQCEAILTLILVMWRIWRVPNNDSRWDLTPRLKG